MRAFLVVAAAVAVAAAAVGCAAIWHESGPSQFEMVDADGDSVITVDEFTTHFFTRVFNLLDLDNDGRIQKAEWLKVEKEKDSEKLFVKLDANKDGALTYAEFAIPPMRRETIRNLFRTLDRNGDGCLDEAELSKKE